VGEPFASRLLASLRAGVVAIDAAGRVQLLNEPARRILELPPADALLGRPCGEAFRDEPVLAELLLAALEGREAPARAELALGGRGARTIGFTLAPVRDRAGALLGAALLFRDLEALERLDERERLRERLAALGEMAAGLAHEIRNPLASLGVLGTLLRRRLPAEGEERALVDDLLGEVRALEATVNAALDFVKPAPGVAVPVDLVAALEAALAQVRARLPFDGELVRAYESPAPCALGDPEQLRGAFANLVANALEAMRGPGPGRLELRAFRREAADDRVLRVAGRGPLPVAARREAVVEVRDSGPGVPEALRERIFYPFFTTRERGSGLGLALVHKAVAGAGGCVELESPAGGGATFRVRLPLRELAP
jgi:nitrogen-specific signal transduction histidine kinase